jgi:uncharacterized protein (UPF0332 family)
VTSEGQKLASQEELRMADEELRAAEQLIAIGLYRIALTRVYFAVFHAARGALYARNLDPKTHQGVMTLFNQHVIRPGLMEVKSAGCWHACRSSENKPTTPKPSWSICPARKKSWPRRASSLQQPRRCLRTVEPQLRNCRAP